LLDINAATSRNWIEADERAAGPTGGATRILPTTLPQHGDSVKKSPSCGGRMKF
jgi:hypothetical protein